MKVLKIGFILSIVASLCSFAYYNNKEKERVALYQEFLKQFEQVELPGRVVLKPTDYAAMFKLEEEKESKEEKISPVLDMSFKDFIPALGRGRMSRLGPSTYRAEVLLTSNKKFDAVIFSVSRPYDRNACSYTIKTFDKKGKAIAEHALGYADAKNKVVLTATEDLELTVKGGQKVGKSVIKMKLTPSGEVLVHGEPNDSKTEKLQLQQLPILQKKAPKKA